eukprot:scaffold443118_cov41-Prasinocladus_malaysianus.AAC.1
MPFVPPRICSVLKDIRNIGAGFHFTSRWLHQALTFCCRVADIELAPFVVIPTALWLKLVIRRSSSRMNNIPCSFKK